VWLIYTRYQNSLGDDHENGSTGLWTTKQPVRLPWEWLNRKEKDRVFNGPCLFCGHPDFMSRAGKRRLQIIGTRLPSLQAIMWPAPIKLETGHHYTQSGIWPNTTHIVRNRRITIYNYQIDGITTTLVVDRTMPSSLQCSLSGYFLFGSY